MKRSYILICLTMLAFCGSAFAASITAGASDNLQADLNETINGVLDLGGHSFSATSPLAVHTGTTIQNGTINFSLAGTDTTLYGLIFDPGATDVTIKNCTFVSNLGLIAMGQGVYSNDTITGCTIQTGAGQSSAGILVMGISCTTSCPGIKITHNYFHDCTSARDWTLWSPSNASLDNNLLFNINDGGQLCNTGENVSFSNNYATHIHRMGQEISMSGTGGLVVRGNVFYDWVAPYYDSEGVSVVMNAATPPPLIDGNYFSLNIAAGSTWGAADPNTHRSGYCIESGGNGCIVSNNILAMQNGAEYVTYMGLGESITGNKCFGPSAWGILFGTDPGPQGNGTATVTGNTTDANIADRPAPPANTFAGPSNSSATPPVVTPPATPIAASSPAPGSLPGLVATSTSSGVALSWTSPITGASVHVFTPVNDCGTLALAGPATSVTIAGLNSGWGYSATVSGQLGGAAVSGTATFMTLGSSPAGTAATMAQLAAPATPIATQPTTPPVATTQPAPGLPSAGPTTTHVIDVQSDGSIKVN